MILIALGANLPSQTGPPATTLRAALAQFPQWSIALCAVAPFYQSRAWPDSNDPPFVNSVAHIETQLEPSRLLDALKEMERAYGRTPGPRNAPRSLDLDVLDYDGRIAEGTPNLPHPRMHERGFVLVPLRDISPAWRHPVSHLSVDDLIGALPPDALGLTRLSRSSGSVP